MELKFQISIKDSLIEMRFASIESFEHAIPAFIQNKTAQIKAQKLTRKLILIQKTITNLLN